MVEVEEEEGKKKTVFDSGTINTMFFFFYLSLFFRVTYI